MRRLAWLLVVLVPLAACTRPAPRFDPDAAVKDFLGRFRAMVEGPPAERASRTAVAMSLLFADPACREATAHVAFAEPKLRETEMQAAVRACGRRYCPELPEHRPSACANLDGASGAALSRLVEAIHERDLGKPRMTRLKQEMERIAASAAASPGR